ncbi:hypothetical protein KY332_01595 [Candidatus Woesearchaeota archaeon]|nr:hypothetical protein [Candidatus Woesearchaeota archaeon]
MMEYLSKLHLPEDRIEEISDLLGCSITEEPGKYKVALGDYRWRYNIEKDLTPEQETILEERGIEPLEEVSKKRAKELELIN